MNRFQSLFSKKNIDLINTLVRHELALMEQGTVIGFFLSFVNNVIMLLVFHSLFVHTFLQYVPSPLLYLIIGIVQWNLYMNISMGGFSSIVYRQRIVIGYRFSKETMILARTGAIFIPYLLEVLLIFAAAIYLKIYPSSKILYLPLVILAQYLFCTGIAFIFAVIGVLHKNIIPFWNIMFRLLSFATPIFYLPIAFKSKWTSIIYSWNPFTVFMLWLRHIFNANGFDINFSPIKIIIGSVLIFAIGYAFFRKFEYKIGDQL